jgi:hypothetical protein
MSRDVCGICWCPYDDDGKCGCGNVQVINPAPSKVMRGTCIRCGKQVRSDDIHTCTPPPGSELALLLEQNAQMREQNTELDAKLAESEALLKQALHALKYRGANEWKVLKPVIEAIEERLK